MKNQKGITLIALVVTIVVLLILAGTAIAMLQGDNGIITQAQNSNYANKEGEVFDKSRLAYNTVSSEVRINSAVEVGYDATTDENLVKLANLVSKDLGGTGTTITTDTLTEKIGNYTITLDKSGKTIKITYDDKSIFTADSGKYSAIEFTMTIDKTSVKLTEPERQVKTSND